MKDEERWELRMESFRVLFTTMVQLCKDDDELIEMCVELETMIDTVKRDINVRQEIACYNEVDTLAGECYNEVDTLAGECYNEVDTLASEC